MDKEEEIEIFVACSFVSKGVDIKQLSCWLRGSGVVGGGGLPVVKTLTKSRLSQARSRLLLVLTEELL